MFKFESGGLFYMHSYKALQYLHLLMQRSAYLYLAVGYLCVNFKYFNAFRSFIILIRNILARVFLTKIGLVNTKK